MKLYAFQPGVHGELSFFTIAETEEEAKKAVKKYVDGKNLTLEPEVIYLEDYILTIAEAGEVIENEND